jgi:integrase
MGRKRRSLVTQREGSPNWYCNFTVKGHRFRNSLGTDDQETAEILAAKIKSDALLGELTDKKPEMTLTEAFARDWLERGQYLVSASHIKHKGRILQDDKTGLGKNTLLSQITTASLISYRSRRRVGVSNGTVNSDLNYLRTVLIRARDEWEVATPKIKKIKWKAIMLEESERERVLTRQEQDRLFHELRADLRPMVLFALVTGVRLSNVVRLTWRQVDWDARQIVFRTKSKKQDGEIHYVPITIRVAAILLAERGRHPVFVFTYVCQKGHPKPRNGTARRKGERYPLSTGGWRGSWYRALRNAGLWDSKDSPDRLRFHDLRHSAATRMLRITRNLKTVQRMLGHKDIKTTVRYAHILDEDVREGMEEEDKAQSRHRVVAKETKM